jgi:hypothetical protein
MKILIQLILTMLISTLFLSKSYAIVQPKVTAIILIEKPTESKNEPSKKTKILANSGMVVSLVGLGMTIMGSTAATGLISGIGLGLCLIGLILSIITLTRKDKDKKIKLKSWLGISVFGLIALTILAILWIGSQQG